MSKVSGVSGVSGGAIGKDRVRKGEEREMSKKEGE
jgi:hypothetical protein